MSSEMAVVSGLPTSSDSANCADPVSELSRHSADVSEISMHSRKCGSSPASPRSLSFNASVCETIPSPAVRQFSAPPDADSKTDNLSSSCLDNVSEEIIDDRLPNTDHSQVSNSSDLCHQSDTDANQRLPEHLLDYVVNDSHLQESFMADVSDPAVDDLQVESHMLSKKGSSKHGKPKRQSERKRKGPSWYSVLSPTYKSRSDDFRRIFKDLPSDERLIVDYSCALQKDILVHGRLYISREWVCFYANIFRWETVLTIRCKDIVRITKEKTARVIPNAILICTKDERYFFTSFGTRDKTFLILDRVWKNCINNQVMSLQELWQWVHYSYGEELGITSSDDVDYVILSSEEKIQFQMRVQREEKLAEQNIDYSGSIRIDSFMSKEPGDEYILTNGELNHLAVPSFVVGSADTDHDSSLTDSLTMANGVDSKTPRYLWDHLDSPNSTALPAAVAADGMATDVNNISTDVEDSTEDEEADRPCSGHAHFSIAVVDELLNIPIDIVFEHCFTDCPLYRDFVKNKKTFAIIGCCRRHEHFDIAVLHEVFQLSVDALFTAIFTDSTMQSTFMSQRKTRDVILSPWPDEADSTGIKVRNIAYTLSLNYSIGPKYSPSTERQIMYPESRPGQFYLIDTECVNGGIPYGENFYVVNRFCIARVSSTKCRLRITSQIKYRKSVWGIVKNFIEKNASAGIVESFNVLAELLRQESNRQAQLALTSKPSLSRKRVLRRRRVSDRCVTKRPSVSDTPHLNVSKHNTPVKHVPSLKAGVVLPEDQWYVKLTASSLIHIICFVLVTLMLFNAFLLYKLWSLESKTTVELLSRHQYQERQSRYPMSAEWSQLLDEQKQLHETEMERWKAVLSNTIRIMDHMVHSLSDLRSSIDNVHVDTDETSTADNDSITSPLS